MRGPNGPQVCSLGFFIAPVRLWAQLQAIERICISCNALSRNLPVPSDRAKPAGIPGLSGAEDSGKCLHARFYLCIFGNFGIGGVGNRRLWDFSWFDFVTNWIPGGGFWGILRMAMSENKNSLLLTAEQMHYNGQTIDAGRSMPRLIHRKVVMPYGGDAFGSICCNEFCCCSYVLDRFHRGRCNSQ